MQFDMKRTEGAVLRITLWAAAIAMVLAVGVYAYLGWFSRYRADDYCEAIRTESSPIAAVIERYTEGSWRAANRYSNILFVGFSEELGPNNMPITMSSMVVFWLVGLCWSVYEIRRLWKIEWLVSSDIFLGGFLAFLGLFLAPNLFQTVYWRSSMMTHFAPLVFGSLLLAFTARQARREGRSHWLVYGSILFVSFIIAGFSEPPTTTMVAALPLLFLAVWRWDHSPAKPNRLTLISMVFAGFFIGMLVMVFSPAGAKELNADNPGLFIVLRDSFYFTLLFAIGSLKTTPLPFVLSGFVTFLFALIFAAPLSTNRGLIVRMAGLPFLAWLLIAAGFAPSVYGQGFPVERMRFLGQLFIILTFLLEGFFLGQLLKLAWTKDSPVLKWAVLGLFALAAVVYPLRATLRIYQTDVPEYRARAELYDLRNEYILRHVAAGEKNIIVPGFPGTFQVKEIDNNPRHWVNTCVAVYYGVDTVQAVSMPDAEIEGFLHE